MKKTPINKLHKYNFQILFQFLIIISLVTMIFNVFAPITFFIYYSFHRVGEQNKYKNYLTSCILTLLTYPVIIYFSLVLKEEFLIVVAFYTISFSGIWLFIFAQSFLNHRINEIAEHFEFESKEYQEILKSKYCFCHKRNVRIKKIKKNGFIYFKCPYSKSCIFYQKPIKKLYEKLLVLGNLVFCDADRKFSYPVNQIIGVINENIKEKDNENNYYINIWNIKDEQCINADYDIIEIQENENIKNYDFIIQEIYSFLYNDLERQKPVSEIEIKIVGNPEISENTMNLLKDKFKSVEKIEL